jgi:hypothetical protein
VRRITWFAILCFLTSQRAEAQARWATLDDFLQNGVFLTRPQMAAIAKGETVGKPLATADERDVAVMGVVRIDVPRSFFVERQRDVVRAATQRPVHVFSTPASLADVQALALSADDLKELRDCRPNDCNFKLPATDMERMRALEPQSADARTRIEAYAKNRVVQHVTDYRDRGNAAMVVYDDRGSIHASDAFDAMLKDSSYVFRVSPSLATYLLEYPKATLPGATDVMFWSVDALPKTRPILRITHQTTFSPPELPMLTMFASKQIYANHYFEAGLDVLTAVDRDDAGTPAKGITLVSVRRYRFDHISSGGLLNIRARVRSGLQDAVLADLARLKRESEGAWQAKNR